MRLASVLALWLALAAVGASGLLTPSAAVAEKAPMSPAALRKTATHVITGKVQRIYVRPHRDGLWAVKDHVAEIAVGEVEKGEGIAEGDLVYARYWHRRWAGRGTPPLSTHGHRGLPSEGDALRVYLARNAYDGFGKTEDGGFNVIGANGFEALEDD